jgi:hypothetical protein
MERFFLQTAEASEAVDDIAHHPEVSLFVGAGVPMEVGMPSWSYLVHRLLARISRDTQSYRKADVSFIESGLQDAALEQQRDKTVGGIVDAVLAHNGLLAAAAIVKGFYGAYDYARAVQDVLYDGHDHQHIRPGPTAVEIARYWSSFADPSLCTVLTTNYDPLLEHALEELGVDEKEIASVLPGTRQGVAQYEVIHLHGVVDPRALSEAPGLVLAEDEYFIDTEEAQERRRLVVDALQRPSLFIGTSLSDPNLLSYLYGALPGEFSGRPQHFALSVQQSEATVAGADIDRHTLAALRETTALRLASVGVKVLHADYHSDVSEFLAEISNHRRQLGAGHVTQYSGAPWRWAERFLKWERSAAGLGLIPTEALPADRFRDLQEILNRFLAGLAQGVSKNFDTRPEIRVPDEQLAVHLWVASPTLRQMILIAQSDRISLNTSTLHRAGWELPTTYLVVESLCNGVVVQASDDELSSSRWGSMIAVPITLPHETATPTGDIVGRLSVGVVVLASASGGTQGLGRLQRRPGFRDVALKAMANAATEVLALRFATSEQGLDQQTAGDALAAELRRDPPTRRRQTAQPQSPRLNRTTAVTGALPESLELPPEWQALVAGAGSLRDDAAS